ncbi:Cell division and transport-associated protein TolA [Halopseudomonas bauzanensis]|uniref:Cell division and transport-associated protein TolA n=2 Tax=Halopseudomonas bauzanensis TaxID=653930 RepID=A0A1I4JV98_9GAMM|nr:Cell division and transport-associated protein TolA [Halopseudomonas bauzanensis]SFL70261.1 colicin import membrane protein [Halopseudomonas bauzanensis]
MSNRDRMPEPGQERFTASIIKAVGLHLLVLILLFVSFSSAPEFEPAKPIVQATLVQLNSKSPATTQTDQKIAGEAERTAAQRHEAEELQREQQQQQEAQEAAQRAAAEQRQAAAATAKAAEEQAAEERQQAERVEQQKAEEAKRKADAAKKLAEEEAAKQKAAEEAAKRKAAEDAKKAAEDAKRKAEAEAAAKQAEADRVAKLKREQEEAKAKALAELLASETQYQQAQADQFGDEVAASYDDVIRRYVSEQWRRPPTARNGMVVEVQISMLPSGDITDVVVVRSSGDAGFDQSAVQAVRNVGRIPEMQQLSRESPSTFDRMYRQRTLRFKPEDLAF